MTALATTSLAPIEPLKAEAEDARLALKAQIASACRRIAPVWPLKHFVAVNPFLGFAGERFEDTAGYLKRTARTPMLMPRNFYCAALADGTIDDAALTAALQAAPTLTSQFADAAAIRAAANAVSAPTAPSPLKPAAAVATVAEVLDALSGDDRRVSLVGFMIDQISSFCAAYFDEGQSSWRMPVRHLKPYAAWRKLIQHDRNPEVMGITQFRKTVLALPADPVASIAEILRGLGIPARAVEDYLFRALFDVGGWAAYARYCGWNAELDGRTDDTLTELLAIRLAWGYGLFCARRDDTFRASWADAMKAAARQPQGLPANDLDLMLDLLLQEAYEIALRTRLTDDW